MDVPWRELKNSPSREAIWATARELMGERLPKAFEREMEADDPLPGIDSIESWGARAVELVGPPNYGSSLIFDVVAGTADGVEVRGFIAHEWEKPAWLAFHSPDALVADISGLRELVLVENEPFVQGAAPQLELSGSFLEWRAYLGEGTLISEGESAFEEEPGGKQPTIRMKLLGSAGMLVGRVLGWMGRPSEPSRDRFMHARLRHFEAKHPAIAEKYPDLSMYKTDPGLFRAIHHEPADGPAMVFIHGTFSCAVPNLAVLDPLGMPAYRFEHDTFLSISENAQRLVESARGYLTGHELHFVAHSRGGLVARLAARELTAKGHKVTVRTYGTPHMGTPLANAGGRMLNALLSMGRTAVGGIFSWDPASLAAKLAFKALTWSKLPEGLDVMRTDSETLKAWRFGEEPFQLVSCGGEYDLRKLADGACAYAFGEALSGGFDGQPNDMVVPTTSALGAGKKQPTLVPCNHFEYFSVAAVQDELRALA